MTAQPSQENLLLDYVRRLESHRAERQAVLLHLSDLRPFNRREHHVRVAASTFEPVLKDLAGQIFVLDSADIFVFFKHVIRPDIENAVQRARFLFSDDPLLDGQDGEDRFATWYDGDTDYDDILAYAQSLTTDEQGRRPDAAVHLDTRAALKARQERGEPLTPEVLARVEQALERADLSNLVRRQYVCSIDAHRVPEPRFSELFISISDLRETLLPGVDMASNRWLFQHLTEVLDKRMLSMLNKTDHMTISGDISFNLNVKTLLSQEFLVFDDNITASRRGAMVVELQQVDIFADLGAYLFAREFVQERGYRVCIDGLSHRTMPLVDRDRLGADLVKLVWKPEMGQFDAESTERVHALVRRTGESRVILCRCDNRDAIEFGRALGITLFQGRHVETMIAEDNRRRELLKIKRRIDRGGKRKKPR